MSLNWQSLTFDALAPAQLYAILRLRQAVFVVEQNCPFLDADGKDANAMHLCGWQDGELLAYARLHPAGVVREQAMISRVVTSPAVRRDGYGRQLMAEALRLLRERDNPPVWLGAQARLEDFYASFGFAASGEPYLEDEIWHIGMVLRPT